ncbi:unnamed protein product, partial [Discosporangium mesarthrocarpum]
MIMEGGADPAATDKVGKTPDEVDLAKEAPALTAAANNGGLGRGEAKVIAPAAAAAAIRVMLRDARHGEPISATGTRRGLSPRSGASPRRTATTAPAPAHTTPLGSAGASAKATAPGSTSPPRGRSPRKESRPRVDSDARGHGHLPQGGLMPPSSSDRDGSRAAAGAMGPRAGMAMAAAAAGEAAVATAAPKTLPYSSSAQSSTSRPGA